MLRALAVKNVGVIEETEVSFGPGLVVLTGETGAGKSLVLEALGLLSGARADPHVVRAGAASAVVDGVFERTPKLAERLAALGLEDHGADVSIRRVVETNGRGRVHVNGALTSVGVLRQLMQGLLEVSGQHEHWVLLEPSKHLSVVDGLVSAEELAEMRSAWNAVLETQQALAHEGGDERQAAARQALLTHELKEIEALSPQAGEDVALDVERRRLVSVEKVRRALFEAGECLSGEEGAVERVARAVSTARDAAQADERGKPLAERLASLQLELDEAARDGARLLSAVEADPARLAEVEERLDALRRLCRKHAAPLEAVVQRAEAMRAELVSLAQRGERREQLGAQLAVRTAAATQVANRLSGKRKQVLKGLVAGVKAHLAALALDGARFEAEVGSAPLGPHGVDTVAFQFCANPGESLRPLSEVASGGEASRLFLAVRAALAPAQGPGCVVLDEADAGVGGAAAEAVGRVIRELAQHRQVLCVTHSPQVAAFADAHLKVAKGRAQGRTRAAVSRLEDEASQVAELARMMSGAAVSPEAHAAAAALVRGARRTGPSARRRPVSPARRSSTA